MVPGAREEQRESSRDQRTELQRQLSLLESQKDRLLNLRILGEIEAETYAAKSTELRDRDAALALQVETLNRGHDEDGDIAHQSV